MSDSESDSDRRRDSDDDADSSSSSKHVLKPIPSMGDMLHPLTDAEKSALSKTKKKATKLSDFIPRPRTAILVTARRKPDVANAVRKYDRRRKKVVTEIPTKEVKIITIERELKASDIDDLTGMRTSRKRQRSPSPSRTDTQRAQDYAGEICDKCDDFQELVWQLGDMGYYRDFLTEDDHKVQQAILTLLDRAIANANRNMNELKSMAAKEKQEQEDKEKQSKDAETEKPSERPSRPARKRQKTDANPKQSSSSSTKKTKPKSKTSTKSTSNKAKSKADKGEKMQE